ncbi:MAG: phosphatase PAP2 family protein [Victivallales bacterium]|nr:phosphatase PAP2 family protein [Victivallales bacterium]
MSKKNNIVRPAVFIIIGIAFLVLALILHPWDYVYKDFIQNCFFQRNRIPAFDYFVDLIATLGKGDMIAIIIVVIAAKGLRKTAFNIALSMLIMAVIVWSLKPTVQRERPNGSNNVSFPSGDTATTSAFFGAAAVEYPPVTPMFIAAPAVGFVRTYKNAHYLSDVTAGLGFGLIAVGIAYYIRYKRFKLLKLLEFLERFKPRIYVLALFIMCLIIFLPEALKGEGTRLDFMELFAPSLFIWMAPAYSKIFLFPHSGKKNIIARFFCFKRKCIDGCFKFIRNRNLSKNIVKPLAVVLVLVSFSLLVYGWSFITDKQLLYSVSGLIFGIMTAVFAVLKQIKINSASNISAVYTSINSFGILVFFFAISFVPAACLY